MIRLHPVRSKSPLVWECKFATQQGRAKSQNGMRRHGSRQGIAPLPVSLHTKTPYHILLEARVWTTDKCPNPYPQRLTCHHLSFVSSRLDSRMRLSFTDNSRDSSRRAFVCLSHSYPTLSIFTPVPVCSHSAGLSEGPGYLAIL